MAVLLADSFPGSDIGEKINAAIASVNGGPAVIKIGDSSYQFSHAIDLRNSKSLRITSDSGNLNTVSDFGPNLIWTGGAGSGAAVKAAGAIALEWDHIDLSYNSPFYDGQLFSLSSTGPGISRNTSTTHIHHCRFCGTDTAKLAPRLVELNTTLALTIEQSTFDFARVGIGCSGPSNNVVTIRDCWIDKHFSDSQIRAWGGTWKLSSVVAESMDDVNVPLTTFLKLDGEVNDITLENVMCLDGLGSGTIIDLSGAPAHGISILGGNYSGGHQGTLLRCHDTAGATSGLFISGARIENFAVGVHLGKSHGSVLRANRLACPQGTPWTGGEPTNYTIANNDYNGAATAGVPVVNDVNNNVAIGITLPGTSVSGRGHVFIYVVEDNASAIYSLNGSMGTTTEISDPLNLFTNVKGTGSKINIYWDATAPGCYRLQNKRGALRTVIVSSLIGL